MLFAAGFVVAGCGGGGGGVTAETSSTGRISVGISDGPIHDAAKVCITFDEVELKRNDESIVLVLDPPAKIDLLSFQGANAAPLIIAEEVPAGQYQWMRLGVEAEQFAGGGANDMGGEDCDGEGSYIVLPTGTHNLYVPSGENNGLKLVGGFTVPVNDTANFTAEFDLLKSVTAPGGLSSDILLRPTIRLVNNAEVGTLMGTVTVELATAGGCNPSVFVFNDGVTPNAIDDMEDDPVATALVSLGDPDYEYAVGYLLAGDYVAAFTCDGENFEPPEGKPVSIEAGVITPESFP